MDKLKRYSINQISKEKLGDEEFCLSSDVAALEALLAFADALIKISKERTHETTLENRKDT